MPLVMYSLIDYAQKLISNNDTHVTILENSNQTKNNFIVENALTALEQKYPESF